MGSEQCRKCTDTGRYSSSFQQGTQFCERSRDSLARRILVAAESGANVREAALGKIAEHERVPVGTIETVEGFIEFRADLFPVSLRIGMGIIHGDGLLFACLPPALSAQDLPGGVTRRAVEPSGQHHVTPQ
jgi:hypothetical protein